MNKPVLAVSGMTFRYPATKYGETFEVRLPDLKIASGEFVALVGPSGCGKSTLLNLLGAIESPGGLKNFTLRSRHTERAHDLTQVVLKGDFDAIAVLRAQAFGYIMQQGGLLPFLTVRQNILAHRPGITDADVCALTKEVGLNDRLQHSPDDLSVGERQRVSIARALAGMPDLIIADEPTASVDPPRARQLMELLSSYASKSGAAIIMANHDWPLLDNLGFQRISPEVVQDKTTKLTSVTFSRERA